MTRVRWSASLYASSPLSSCIHHDGCVLVSMEKEVSQVGGVGFTHHPPPPPLPSHWPNNKHHPRQACCCPPIGNISHVGAGAGAPFSSWHALAGTRGFTQRKCPCTLTWAKY